MKIAVLLPGHLRAWSFCRNNFFETILDHNHSIDVFVETYNEVFRSDSYSKQERDMRKKESEEDIRRMFDDINVVSFSIEPEFVENPNLAQGRKILKVYDSFKEYEEKNGKYDLAIRSRFDIMLRQKLEYEKIFDRCNQDRNLIIIGKNKTNNLYPNDMFAVTNSDTFHIYCNRFRNYNSTAECVGHYSLSDAAGKNKLNLEESIEVSIVRLDENQQFVTHE